ncbi:MAG: hypothetical protein ACLUD2_18780 [Clostridium sp.]
MAVDHINAQIREGSVFGLVRTNGAGKSTFLRDGGRCAEAGRGKRSLIDGMRWYMKNGAANGNFSIFPTTSISLGNADTGGYMMNYYQRIVYPESDEKRFDSA